MSKIGSIAIITVLLAIFNVTLTSLVQTTFMEIVSLVAFFLQEYYTITYCADNL